jgi:hypothetical protein
LQKVPYTLVVWFGCWAKMFTFHAKKKTPQQKYYAANKHRVLEKAKARRTFKEEQLKREKQELDGISQWEEEQTVILLLQIREKMEIVPILLSIRTVVLDSLFDELEDLLKNCPCKSNYRKFIKTQWSFHIGYTTQTIGISEFFKHPHPIQRPPWTTLGCDVRCPLSKTSIPDYQKDMLLLATKVMKIIDPEYVRLQYVVHFARMSSNQHHCRVHTDDRDIAPQYIIHFGNWTGAELRVHNTFEEKRTSEFTSFSEPRKIIYLDARMAHEVVKNNFNGVRFTMIVYQLWREDKSIPDPCFYPPKLLN